MNKDNIESTYNKLYNSAQRAQSSAKILGELKNLPLSNEFCSATIRNEGLMAQNNIYGILENLEESDRINVMQNAYTSLECIKTQCELYGNQDFFASKIELYSNIINANHEIMLSKYLCEDQESLTCSLNALPSLQRDYFQSYLGNQLVKNGQLSSKDDETYIAIENILNTSMSVCSTIPVE